ncbi:MAG TPA: acyl transferase [Chitinophagaceae bacterium]|jgi:hypothetical protein
MEQMQIVNNIFEYNQPFNEKAIQVFKYQYLQNNVYRIWNDILKKDIASISSLADIPFLPVSFFKTHKVVCGAFDPRYIFESSGTTESIPGRHYLKDTALYKKSFLLAFKIFYGDVKDWCIIGLLPSYLERKNSSLVVMVDELIKQSNNALSGFYLYDFKRLKDTLMQLEKNKQKTLLIGVSFALLDFAEQYPMHLQYTLVMETGGMKGRRKELTRQEMHSVLCNSFGIDKVHSEYGMTELLSQAYSKGEGKFFCPPWMKVLVRDDEDPVIVKEKGRGILNIIDLANIYSCSFIATDDVGTIHEDDSFEVLGRVDNSDIRGCSLMVV